MWDLARQMGLRNIANTLLEGRKGGGPTPEQQAVWDKEQERRKHLATLDPRLLDPDYVQGLHDAGDHSGFWGEVSENVGENLLSPRGGYHDGTLGPGHPHKGTANIYDPVGQTVPEVQGAVAPAYDWTGIGGLVHDWYVSKGHEATADRARTLAKAAIRHGIDPYLASALGAEEGGWLRYESPHAPHNYLGWGETDAGSHGYGAESFDEWLDIYLPKMFFEPIYGETPYGERGSLREWGGKDLAEGDYQFRYNYNDSWINNISSLMRDLEAFRDSQGAGVAGPRIRY